MQPQVVGRSRDRVDGSRQHQRRHLPGRCSGLRRCRQRSRRSAPLELRHGRLAEPLGKSLRELGWRLVVPPFVLIGLRLALRRNRQPAPFVGTAQYPNGSSRPGPNLYTDSTVALKIATGKLVWYHQAHAHDLFDRDFVHTMIVPVPASNGSVRHHRRRRHRQGRRRDRHEPLDRTTTLADAGRNPPQRQPDVPVRSDRSSARHLRRGPDPSGLGPGHGLRRHPRMHPTCCIRTRPPTSEARRERCPERWSHSTPGAAARSGTPTCPVIRPEASRW